jgi:hypothetical protein
MKYVSLSVLLLAALAAGNPTIETFINEFGFDDDGLGWVELHAEPYEGEVGMGHWLLTTNTSVCTFAYTMPYGGFLVVDSASLAGGEYGRGTFRLDPAGDTIRILPDVSQPQFRDEVVFPVLPAGLGRAPMPPDHGSASILNLDGWLYDQPINWYIDSTPTPEWYNNDYSTVTGTVTWAPGRNFDFVRVVVTGPLGGSSWFVMASGLTYEVLGLSAGRYEVLARGYPGGERVFYPDSVDVGYSETLPGINLDFDPQGVEEGQQTTACGSRPAATVLRGLPSGAVAFDAMGRRVTEPKPGVYFVGEGSGTRGHGSGKMRKVIIQK